LVRVFRFHLRAVCRTRVLEPPAPVAVTHCESPKVPAALPSHQICSAELPASAKTTVSRIRRAVGTLCLRLQLLKYGPRLRGNGLRFSLQPFDLHLVLLHLLVGAPHFDNALLEN